MNELAELALSRIDQSDPEACWLWPGSGNGRGYGRIYIRGTSAIKTRYAMVHRVIYEALKGPIPEGLTLDHVCHDPQTCKAGFDCQHRRCVNPSHLEPVDRATNVRRGGNAQKTHCRHGHSFAENSYAVGSERRCRICERERDRRLRPWRYK